MKLLSCRNCKYKKEINPYSSDGYDRMVDWICTANHNKFIQGCVEWHDETKIEMPNWCPIVKEIISNYEKQIEEKINPIFVGEGI